MNKRLLVCLYRVFLVVGLPFSFALPAAAHLVQAEAPAPTAPASDHSLWQDFTHGRFYVSGRLGFVGTEDVKYANELGEPVVFLIRNINHYTRGRSAGLSLGYGFSCARFEFASNYSENRLDSVDIGEQLLLNETENFPGAHVFNVTGRSELVDFLVNFYWDFRNKTRFTPFVSFGVGAVYARNDSFVDLPSSIIDENRRVVNDEDWGFAYQAKAGFNYKASLHWLAGLELRYLVFDRLRFAGQETILSLPDFPTVLNQYQKGSRFSRSLRFNLAYLFPPANFAG